MKRLFTHQFVIYEKGFVFRWEPKAPQTPYGLAAYITKLVAYGILLAIVTGALSV